MIRLSIKEVKVVDATESSGSRFWIEHPQNDAILASADTQEEVDFIVKSFRELGAVLEQGN